MIRLPCECICVLCGLMCLCGGSQGIPVVKLSICKGLNNKAHQRKKGKNCSPLNTPEDVSSHGKIQPGETLFYFLFSCHVQTRPAYQAPAAYALSYLNQLDPAGRDASRRHTLTSYRERNTMFLAYAQKCVHPALKAL